MKKLKASQITPYLTHKLKVLGKRHYLEYGKSPQLLVNGIAEQHSPTGNFWQYEFLVDEDLKFCDINEKGFKPILIPLNNLLTDKKTLREMAVIADCHFKEEVKVKDYKFYKEDGCQVCEVSWGHDKSPAFEISWGLDYHDGLDERNGNVSLVLVSMGMVHNTQRIFELLYSKHYDVERLIEQGLAVDKNKI